MGFVLLLVGLLLPAGEDGIVVQSTAFHDSVIVGLICEPLDLGATACFSYH